MTNLDYLDLNNPYALIQYTNELIDSMDKIYPFDETLNLNKVSDYYHTNNDEKYAPPEPEWSEDYEEEYGDNSEEDKKIDFDEIPF